MLLYLHDYLRRFHKERWSELPQMWHSGSRLAFFNKVSKPANSFFFPSVSEIFGKLSAALHGADADAVLFDSTATVITEHFDVRRVFKLDARPASVLLRKHRSDETRANVGKSLGPRASVCLGCETLVEREPQSFTAKIILRSQSEFSYAKALTPQLMVCYLLRRHYALSQVRLS